MALIDKCALVITVLGATFLLGEAFTWKTGLSVGLVMAGLVLAAFSADGGKKDGAKGEAKSAPAEPQPAGAE